MYSITGSLGNSGGREQLSVKIRVVANIKQVKGANDIDFMIKNL